MAKELCIDRLIQRPSKIDDPEDGKELYGNDLFTYITLSSSRNKLLYILGLVSMPHGVISIPNPQLHYPPTLLDSPTDCCSRRYRTVVERKCGRQGLATASKYFPPLHGLYYTRPLRQMTGLIPSQQ